MNATVQARAEYKSLLPDSGTNIYGEYTLEIVDSEEAAADATEFAVSPEGAQITYEADQENVLTPVVPSTCTFTLHATTAAQVTKLKNIAKSDAGRYGVQLRYRRSNLTVRTIWVGTLLNDQIQIADALPQAVNLTATDDLGYLQGVKYLDSDGTRYTGTATVLQHLVNVLGHLRTSWYWDYAVTVLNVDYYPIAINFIEDLVPQTYSRSASDKSIIEEAQIPHGAFYRENDSATSVYEVLEGICTYFQSTAQIVMSHATTPRLHITPFAAYQQYAEDQTQLPNRRLWRSDGVAVGGGSPLPPLDISNDAGNGQRREAGGMFSYLRPYNKVEREVSFELNEWAVNFNVNDEDEYDVLQTFTVESEVGQRYRLVGNHYHNYEGPVGGLGLYWVSLGNQGEPPWNYGIARIRVRYRIELVRTGNNNVYLKRPLSTGGQVPVYEAYGNTPIDELPLYYTDLSPQVEATWDASDATPDYYVQITPPFDLTEDQIINIPIDIVTPEVPHDTEQIKVAVQLQLLTPTNAVAEYITTGDGIIFDLGQYSTQLRIYDYDGVQLNGSGLYQATNDTNANNDLELNTGIITDAVSGSLNFATPRYRQGNGLYQAEVFNFTSSQESTAVFPSAQLYVDEAARYYRTPKELYDGTIIFHAGLIPISPISVVELDDVYYKLGQCTYNTGYSRLNFQGMEMGRSLTAPTSTFETLGGILPPPPTGGSTVRQLQRQTSSIAETQSDVVAAFEVARGTDRNSQTGENVITIDSDGVFQEVTDGSAGQFLTTDGSGAYSFDAQSIILASISARVTTQYTSNYYYGNSSYGFNYPIWSGITFNNTQGNPYALQISDDYAHNGVLLDFDASEVSVSGTIRNDSTTDNLDVILCYGPRPNGSSSNIQLVSLGSTKITVSNTDRHYNFSVTGGAVSSGNLIFLGIRRSTGTTSYRYINFSATITAKL